MKKILIFSVIAYTVLALSGCSNSGETKVILKFGTEPEKNLSFVERAVDTFMRSFTTKAYAFPFEGLSSLSIKVEGEGMDTVTANVSADAGFLVMFVPSGKNRKFTIEGSTPKWDYIGEAVADLEEGKAVEVPIVLGMKQVVYFDGIYLLMKDSITSGTLKQCTAGANDILYTIDFNLSGDLYFLYSDASNEYRITKNIGIFNKNELNYIPGPAIITKTDGETIKQFQFDRKNNSIIYLWSALGTDTIEISNFPYTESTQITSQNDGISINSFSYNENTETLSVSLGGFDDADVQLWAKRNGIWTKISSSFDNYANYNSILKIEPTMTAYGKYFIFTNNYGEDNNKILIVDAETFELVSTFGLNPAPYMGLTFNAISQRSNRVIFSYQDTYYNNLFGSFFDYAGITLSTVEKQGI